MMMKTPFATGRLYSGAFKLGLEVIGSSLDLMGSLLTRTVDKAPIQSTESIDIKGCIT